jgi:hypothetical protein
MKNTILVKKEVELKTLHVEAGVRYWEDATVNGKEDVDGLLIPCKDGDTWKPIIDIDNGQILNWNKGTEADIHYKVCDDGSYFIKDADGETVLSIEGDYVPKLMCPKGEGYGDYIIMDVDKDGFIGNWKANLNGFRKYEE